MLSSATSDGPVTWDPAGTSTGAGNTGCRMSPARSPARGGRPSNPAPRRLPAAVGARGPWPARPLCPVAGPRMWACSVGAWQGLPADHACQRRFGDEALGAQSTVSGAPGTSSEAPPSRRRLPLIREPFPTSAGPRGRRVDVLSVTSNPPPPSVFTRVCISRRPEIRVLFFLSSCLSVMWEARQ